MRDASRWLLGTTHGERIESELVLEARNVLRTESGANEHGPQIPRIEVALVVIDAVPNAQSEPESAQFKKVLASPGGHVNQHAPPPGQ